MTSTHLLTTDRLRRLAASVESLFRPSPSRSYLHHTFRVANYAARIAADEQLDVEAITAAALVHDIGMVIDPSFGGHIAQTAALAPLILTAAGFSSNESVAISRVAAAHHPPADTKLSDTLEQVLFDADTLEIIGVFGFLRWFGAIPSDLHELANSARLFIDIVQSGRSSRGEFFYTRMGRALGSDQLTECVALCKSLVSFVSDAKAGSPTLRPLSFGELLQKTDSGKSAPR